MDDEAPEGEAGAEGLEVLETLATTEAREHLLARRVVGGEEQLVVIKRLTPRASQAGDFVEIYTAEAEHAAHLVHDNVVRCHSVSDEGPGYDVVCEHVPGTPLDRLLDKLRELGEVMPIEHAFSIMIDVAAAVAHGHAYRSKDVGTCVLHQDLAPENVLISEEGAAKVDDFGIGRASRMSSMTVVGGRQRRLGRLSPEQLVGKVVDERSDVFALGVMLYEVSVGLAPFSGDSDFELMAAIDEASYTPPSARVGGYLPDLEMIVSRAMSTDPEERFESVQQMRDALEAVYEGNSLEVSRAALREWIDEKMAEAAPAPPPTPPPPKPPPLPPEEGSPRFAVRADPKPRRGVLAWIRRIFGIHR